MTGCKRIATLLLALATPASVAGADGINFDEVPAASDNCCFLSTEYMDMGVEFMTTDDGSIWAGMSNGDPGAWSLEGSNGAAFLGFNGKSYSARMLFDTAVTNFSMDVARANGSSGQVKIKLTGYLEGEIVSQSGIYLSGTNQWLPLALDGVIDEVEVYTAGSTAFRPYGVDNIQWEPAAPDSISVAIDIEPDSDANCVDPASNGVVTVLLAGSEALGVEQVHPDSLAFGPNGAARAHENGPHYTDTDGDGLLDLIVHFPVQDTGVLAGDAELCLDGETLDGVPFDGCDVVNTAVDDPACAPPAEVDDNAGTGDDDPEGSGHHHHHGHVAGGESHDGHHGGGDHHGDHHGDHGDDHHGDGGHHGDGHDGKKGDSHGSRGDDHRRVFPPGARH